jgi:hypothetical protein
VCNIDVILLSGKVGDVGVLAFEALLLLPPFEL